MKAPDRLLESPQVVHVYLNPHRLKVFVCFSSCSFRPTLLFIIINLLLLISLRCLTGELIWIWFDEKWWRSDIFWMKTQKHFFMFKIFYLLFGKNKVLVSQRVSCFYFVFLIKTSISTQPDELDLIFYCVFSKHTNKTDNQNEKQQINFMEKCTFIHLTSNI